MVSSLGGIVIPIMVVQTGDKRTVAKVDADLKKLGNTVGRLTNTTKKAKKASVEYYETQEKGTWGTRRRIKEVQKNVRLSNGMIGSMTKTKEVGNNLLGTMNALRWSMVNIGFAMGALAAMAYPFVQLGKFGMELETLFTKVEVVTGTASDSALDSIRNLREGTMYSLQEMGEGFLEFSKQGFDAAETIQALPSIMALATTGFTDMATAVKITAQTMHEFGLQAEQAGHIADVIAKAANVSAADVETFGIALSYAGPIAAQAGLSFEETAASISILSNMGLSASKSGTSFAAALTQLIKPTDRTRDKMRKLGLSFFDAKGDMKDIDVIVKELSSVLGGLADEEKLKFLTETFGARGARAISGLMASLETGQGSIASFVTEINDTNYAVDQMVKVQETSAGRLKVAWNDFKDSFVGLGNFINDQVAGALNIVNLVNYEKRLEVLNERIRAVGGTEIESFKAPVIATLELEEGVRGVNEEFDNSVDKLNEMVVGMNLLTSIMEKIPFIGDKLREPSIEEKAGAEKKYIAITSATDLRERFDVLKEMGNIDFNTTMDGLEQVNGEMEQIGIHQTLQDIQDMAGMAFEDLTGEELRKAELLVFRIQEAIGGIEPIGLLQREEGAIKDIQEYGNMDIMTKGMIDKLTEEFESLPSILAGNVGDLGASPEQVKRTEELREAIVGVYNEQQKVNASQQAYTDLVADAIAGFQADREMKQIGELRAIGKTFEEIIEAGQAGGEGGFLRKMLFDVNMLIPYAESLASQVEENQEQVEYWGDEVERINGLLDTQKKRLKTLQEELKGVNAEIKKLSSPRFTGQLQADIMMKDFERWEKEQNLAEHGVTAQELLNRAVGMTRTEYDQLYFSITSVNDELASGENSFEAWQENLREWIRGAIKEGNLLGSNVTEAVKRFGTQLLSTSKFTEDSSSDQENSLSLLKDAYDVYYGGMTDDVKFAIQAHKEEEEGVYNSSQSIISSLQEQWKAQDRIGSQMETVQGKISNYTDELLVAETNVDTFTDAVEILTEKLEDLADSYKRVAEEALEAQQYKAPQLDDNGGGGGGSNVKEIMIQWIKNDSTGSWGQQKDGSDVPEGWSFYDLLPKGQKPYNDFLMRPGQDAISFSPDDTIIGVKDTSALGGSVTIGEINISGVDGDPQEIASRIAEEIRMEMRLG